MSLIIVSLQVRKRIVWGLVLALQHDANFGRAGELMPSMLLCHDRMFKGVLGDEVFKGGIGTRKADHT